jgi:hypothetical protein
MNFYKELLTNVLVGILIGAALFYTAWGLVWSIGALPHH